jgi:hypothetical protein
MVQQFACREAPSAAAAAGSKSRIAFVFLIQ